MLHGVAHVRISTSPCAVDADFYAVFVRGKMLPIQFPSWLSAFRHFQNEQMEVAA
jgi:hypothetical protein